jgi:hypothetical protein
VFAPPSYITMAEVAYSVKAGIIAAFVWGLALLCIKFSVLISLLRFQQNRAWQCFLHFFAVVIALNGFIPSIFLVLFLSMPCPPSAGNGARSIAHVKCIDSGTLTMALNPANFINIITDVVLSLYPLTFLYKLRRPFLEKALVFALMAVGLTATAAALIKILWVYLWGSGTVTLSIGFTLSMWASVEMLLGVIAACLPSLKSTFQRGLARLGVKFQPGADDEQSIYQGPSFVARVPETDHELRTMRASSQASDSTFTHTCEGPCNHIPEGLQPGIAEGSSASATASAVDLYASLLSESETKLVKGKEKEIV